MQFDLQQSEPKTEYRKLLLSVSASATLPAGLSACAVPTEVQATESIL
ncbi:hypothetical protein ACXYMX_07610 [Sporosarcina sp. CAU 1771]